MKFPKKTGMLAIAFAGIESVASAARLENDLVRVDIGDRGEPNALVVLSFGKGSGR